MRIQYAYPVAGRFPASRQTLTVELHHAEQAALIRRVLRVQIWLDSINDRIEAQNESRADGLPDDPDFDPADYADGVVKMLAACDVHHVLNVCLSHLRFVDDNPGNCLVDNVTYDDAARVLMMAIYTHYPDIRLSAVWSAEQCGLSSSLLAGYAGQDPWLA
jgi:hypothetical protein